MLARKNRPYQSLATIYDYVMRHVDYEEWAAYIQQVMERFSHRPRTLADLACGTGNISLELYERGYPVTVGADISESMLRIAREKAIRAGYSIEFVQRDLRSLGDLGSFDAAVCMYDSFNYLLTPDHLAQALRQVYRILNPNGLFIFDVCTERNSRLYFEDVKDREEGPGFSYERHSFYDEKKRLQMNHFTMYLGELKEPIEELHVQRIYPVDEIVEVLKTSPFELLGLFDGFTFGKGSEESDRIHFVLRRTQV